MPKVIKERKAKTERKEKEWRVQYKEIGLTYSRCPMEREKLLEFLMEKHEIEEFFVAREEHKEEGDCPYHLHAWIKLVNKPNIRSAKYWDFEGYHPNVGKKKKNWVWNYLKNTKLDKKIDETPLTNIPEGYVGLAQSGKTEEALALFARQHPKEYVINLDRVTKHIRKLGRAKRVETIYKMGTDWRPDWDITKVSLWVYGPSGVGKTQYVKSLLTEMGKTFIRVTHIDGLKEYEGEDVIIWDDINFTQLTREACIHIATVEDARDIHCRHRVQHLPPGIGNVFLSNVEIWPEDETGAIDRRVKKFDVGLLEIRFY